MRGRSGSRRRRRSTSSASWTYELLHYASRFVLSPSSRCSTLRAFHVMGSPDVVTLHVQYWFFGVGFVWALAGLLAERVPAWILWPFVLLLLVAPRIGRRFHVTEADLFLDYLFVLAALLVVLWITDRARWRIVLASILLGGMVLTKREGMLLAAVLLAAAFVASARQWRSAWPALGVVAVVVAAVAAPWRIWYVVHGVAGEAPTGGGLDPTENAARSGRLFGWRSTCSLSSDYWSVIIPVAAGALVLAALVRAYVLVVFFGVLVGLVTLGGGWITWAIPELPITQDSAGTRSCATWAPPRCCASPRAHFSCPRLVRGDGRPGGRGDVTARALDRRGDRLRAPHRISDGDCGRRFAAVSEPTLNACARRSRISPSTWSTAASTIPSQRLWLATVSSRSGSREPRRFRTDAGAGRSCFEGVPSLEIAREIQAEAATVDLSTTARARFRRLNRYPRPR